MSVRKDNYLREYLEALGITQEAAGEIINVQKAAVNKIANGHRSLRPDYAQRLWKAFGLPQDDWRFLYDTPPSNDYISEHRSFDDAQAFSEPLGSKTPSKGLQAEEEQALIELWRELSPDQRSALISFIEATVDRGVA